MLIWMIAALCAYYVKGLCGFANTLVFTSVLAFGSSNAGISPVELLLSAPTNAIIAWRERRAIDARICLPLIAMVLLGSLPGALMLRSADTGLIKILFGAVIIFVSLDMLAREKTQPKAGGSGLMMAVIGVLSGVLCGLFGVGALLSAYVSRAAKDSHAFRANMCAVFTAENAFRIVVYAASGLLTAQTVWCVVMLAPFMLAGLFLGMRSAGRLDERRVRRLVMVMLMISGAALILQNL
ncbi:MAG: sulfite exporter TauE/SafE family protein [Clostridia bacterium]|nr:sulfite exporter TauE/SafE family protein [Clostridia bacterium]